MQAYGEGFARLYDRHWGRFARQAAPRIREFYESTPLGGENHTLLDLCCGAAHLSLHFLEHGYRVIGIDLSEPMLRQARQNAAPYLVSEQADFFQADASRFALKQKVGLAVSTFDALNHLENFAALQSSFECVFATLAERGTFIFDLNTRHGLKYSWSGLGVQDTEDLTVITRGVYVEAEGRAYTQVTGFLREASGLFARIDETVFNTVFDMNAVLAALFETGFQSAYPAQLLDLGLPLDEPESEDRVFFVARK